VNEPFVVFIKLMLFGDFFHCRLFEFASHSAHLITTFSYCPNNVIRIGYVLRPQC
jgi:hypothetical protein